MTTQQVPSRSAVTPEYAAGRAALFILLLTSFHHIWGAVIYDTPWRLHIVFVSLPVAAAIVALLYVAANESGGRARTARRLAFIVIFVFPIVLIGLYEGGFNHLVKNVIFFHAGEAATRSVFSAEIYKMPDDLVFEVSGVAQFFAALYALWTLKQVARAW